MPAGFGTSWFDRPTAGVDDMIALKELEQTHLMGNLQARFKEEAVYTYIGDIVVSVNPFKDTGNSTPDVQQRYVKAFQQRESPTKLPPHIYMLVGQAYAQMRDGTSKSLSVLISGESGAGKTEAMKLCVSHLGAVSDGVIGAGAGDDGGEGNVAMRLMKTNPIMEPIGNAKTVRNNNSSRFGKHFDIQFDRGGKIVGANTSVYLLEKPRITNHMKGERNYHIFYMFCKAPEVVRKHGLVPGEDSEGLWEQFKVLNQAGTVQEVTSWNDVKEFGKMHQALNDLGFSANERGQLYALIGIVLHLGNVEFGEDLESDDGATLIINEPQYLIACELLKIDPAVFRNALTNELVTFGTETVERKLSKSKTEAARNSLCMQIYSLAFEWCVKKINEMIAMPEHEVFRCIGVLDIFGFENFDSLNSFPQLCINLTNEKLHHLFIEHIFEVEQRFYESEGVEWEMVAYQDNKPIIDLITKKPGIFSVVNDACQQSKMGAGGGVNDDGLLQSMHAAFDQKKYKAIYKRPNRPNAFVIHHYAGSVTYTIDGFIEKNKDELGPSIAAVLETHTGFDRLKRLANDYKKRMETAVLDKQAAGSKGKDKKPQRQTRQKTVSESFGESLSALMDKLSVTDHAYIRCLKPNHTLLAGDWNADLMLKQLAYSGTLEVCKVRKAGLTVRKPLARFYDWYKITAKNMRKLRAPSVREQCKLLMEQLTEIDPSTWRVGKTLVFLASYDIITALDQLREERVKDYARLIWSYWRMRKEWVEYKNTRRLIINFQNVYRGVRTKKAYRELREKTLILQHAGLVKIARERVKDLRDEDLLREEPGLLQEYIPDVDEMVNTDTSEVLSLTRAIAANMFPDVAKLAELNEEQKKQLEAKRKELRENPELLLSEANDASLTTLVYQNILWQRSGAHVSVGGQVGAKTVAVAEKPTVPKFKTAEHGGAIGWLAAQIEALPHEAVEALLNDEPGVAQAASKSASKRRRQRAKNASRRHGGGRYNSVVGDLAPSTSSVESQAPSHQMYASLRQGTLTLEELMESGSSERVAVRTCPLALWRVAGVYPAAFRKGDEGKHIKIVGNKVQVGSVERPIPHMIKVSAEDVKLREREKIAGVMQTGQEIVHVQDHVGGKVTLRDPAKPDNRYFFYNVPPADLAVNEARLVLEQERTLVWEGAEVHDANQVDTRQARRGVLGWVLGRRGSAASAGPVLAPGGGAAADEAAAGWRSWLSSKRQGRDKKQGEQPPALVAPSADDAAANEDDDAFDGFNLPGGNGDGDGEEEEEEEWKKADENEASVRERIFLRPPDYALDQTQAKMAAMQLGDGNDVSFLLELATHINDSIRQSKKVDDFIIQPPPTKEEEEAAALSIDDVAELKAEKSERIAVLRQSRVARDKSDDARKSITPNAAADGERGSAGDDPRKSMAPPTFAATTVPSMPSMPSLVDPQRAKKERGVLKEGFLMRKLHTKGQWGRRYFVLYKDGQLKWFTDHDDAELEPQLAATRRLGRYGQCTLRFFCVSQLTEPTPAQLKGEEYEDAEMELMLASCTHFELRSGAEALHLAWHHAIADEWIQLLTLQCLLSYQKAPVFSDKFVPVQWPDGEIRSEYVGENTTTTDVIKRQCRSRKRHVGPGPNDYGPLVADAADWGLFERQRHEQSERSLFTTKAVQSEANLSGADHINLANSPMHKLPSGEPILDQLLLRWESVARREYGVAVTVPKDAFQLLLRKTRTRGIKGVSKEEQQLEFWQARDDLLDGRLTRCLGRKEVIELAAVLALWEMHDRGPRGGHSLQVALRNLRLQRHKNPTLDFDVRPDELYLVLPAAMLKTERATVASYHELKARYKTLLKDKHVSDHDVDSRVTSDTWRAVHDVRSESVGVQYDSHGQVVIDKFAAERIIRYRLSREPLGFGAQYSVRVWTGVGVPLRTCIAAINADGLHLYTWDRDPLPIASLKFEWHADNTIVGWQGVEHEYNDEAERAIFEAHLQEHDHIGHTSLVVHALTPSLTPLGDGSGGMDDSTLMADSNRVSGALRAGHRHASLTGAGGMQLNLPIGGLGAASADAPRPSARGGGLTARDRRSHRQGGDDAAVAKPPQVRQRAKLILLTTEGQDMEAQLGAYAQEHVNKVRARRLAAKQKNTNARAALQEGVMMLRGTVMGEASSGGSKWSTTRNLLAASAALRTSRTKRTGAGALGGGLLSARPARGMAGSMTSR